MITLTILAVILFSLIITATLMQVVIKLVRSSYKMAPVILLFIVVFALMFWFEIAITT
jgi:hypothetical protein